MVLTCDIDDVLQDYINRISLPRLLSRHPDDPLGLDMQLFLTKAKSQDPKKIGREIENFLKKDYQKELEELLKLKLEQAECEVRVRLIMEKWLPKVRALRKDLRKKSGINFMITGYDN
ncbi:hypothetical protein LY11_02235 [Pedobacter cryoconitis]|uniref:Uncharacterized protein n=2 Tax=Pedobacter cryoconitis TaxID=188932 RepID=A0A327STP8_9SPHI|nr:hypothetical protein LY11_02235 [Pedobacter cryoconitis]